MRAHLAARAYERVSVGPQLFMNSRLLSQVKIRLLINVSIETIMRYH